MLKASCKIFLSVAFAFFLWGCDDSTPWNSPYGDQTETKKVRYTSFTEPILTLDPAKAYTDTAHTILSQVYESPLQYHYLKRPYTLDPLILTEVPNPVFYDDQHQPLPMNADHTKIAYTLYHLTLKHGLRFAPHPAFAKDTQGHFRYHAMHAEDWRGKKNLKDFSYKATRELEAGDLAYAIKRLASPKVNCPIYGVLADYILGFRPLRSQLKLQKNKLFLDLRKFSLEGVEVIDRYHLNITIKGEYPQFLAWLSMGFFSPIPWEVDAFYSQKGMSKRNLSFDWYPVGTGPYQLTEHNPNRRMVLERNPEYQHGVFPAEGSPGDDEQGFLKKAGLPLPFIDKLYVSLEKESIPRWAKFLQGYYDLSAVSSNSFDQAIRLDQRGHAHLSEAMKSKGIRMEVTVQPIIYYLAFNWLDPVVGGHSENKRKLRQAIAIAMNFDDYVQIFLNGQGRRGQGLIPPGIFGYTSEENGINSAVYKFSGDKIIRRSHEEAARLLGEAGYGNGIDPKTGKPLRLQFDVAAMGPTASAYLAWIHKQFQSLGIDVQVRNTQFNRYQEKIRQGDCQIFMSNWLGDYPDPENFMFLLYGPNGKKHFGGVNVTNYKNEVYDRLFLQMKTEKNKAKRQAYIDKMTAIIYHDLPLVAAYYPISFKLLHQWAEPAKPIALTGNFFKYLDFDPQLRTHLRAQWNAPEKGLLWAMFALFSFSVIVVLWVIRKRSRSKIMDRYEETSEENQ